MDASLDTSFRALAAAGLDLILGSGSSSRKNILSDLGAEYGFDYRVRSADIDERAIRADDPADLVLALGHAKADAVVAALAGEGTAAGTLITGDQVVVWRGAVLEKPESKDEAVRLITGYGQHPAGTVGSVVVTDLATGARAAAVCSASCHFSPISPAEAGEIVAGGDVMWCAGALMVEHPVMQAHLLRMEGAIDNVQGLDKATLMRLLLELAGSVKGGA